MSIPILIGGDIITMLMHFKDGYLYLFRNNNHSHAQIEVRLRKYARDNNLEFFVQIHDPNRGNPYDVGITGLSFTIHRTRTPRHFESPMGEDSVLSFLKRHGY